MRLLPSTARVATPFLITACFASLLISAEKTYSSKSRDETEIVSLVLKAEIQANGWTKNEVICFSIQETDPSPGLVKALRQRNLNVRSSAEWKKKFKCGFEVQLAYTKFDLTQSTEVRSLTIRSRVVDLREINKGEGDLGLLQTDCEYVLTKSDSKWSISDCVPKNLVALILNSR